MQSIQDALLVNQCSDIESSKFHKHHAVITEWYCIVICYTCEQDVATTLGSQAVMYKLNNWVFLA